MDSDWIGAIVFMIVLILIIGAIIMFIPGSRGFLAAIAPVLMGLGAAAKVWNRDDDSIICKHCYHELESDAEFCSYCGKRVNDKCRNCGNKLEDEDEFCPVCGTRAIPYGNNKDINDVIRDIENRKCRNCGYRLEDNNKFCPRCGSKRIYK